MVISKKTHSNVNIPTVQDVEVQSVQGRTQTKEEEKERCENVVKEGKSYFEKLPLNKSCVNRFW